MDTPRRAPRVPLNFRISQERIDGYDAMAAVYGLDRASVIRAHLAVAEKRKDEVRTILEQMVAGR